MFSSHSRSTSLRLFKPGVGRQDRACHADRNTSTVVDDAEEHARSFVLPVLDIELFGGVAEGLVEHDALDVCVPTRRPGSGPPQHVDAERLLRLRIDDLGDLLAHLVVEVQRGHVRTPWRRSDRRRRSHG